MAAALAYYATFSLAPILVIVLAVVGIFYERQAASGLIVSQIQSLLGEQGGQMINNMLEASQDLGTNPFAILLGLAALVYGATGVFG